MKFRFTALAMLLTLPIVAHGGPPTKPVAACRRVVVEGELNAGQGLTQEIGGGLKVYFQPIQSGWILRVLPVAGPTPEHDYAEVATPPYQSVTPLSVSTDFAFRAQDAVGWNPRRFRFATTPASFGRLQALYREFSATGSQPSQSAQEGLAKELAQTSEGTLTVLDSKLVPGTADQWRMAGAVASHFGTTAHTLVEEPDHSTSALGRVVWIRFRLELEVPQGFSVGTPHGSMLRMEPRVCATP